MASVADKAPPPANHMLPSDHVTPFPFPFSPFPPANDSICFIGLGNISVSFVLPHGIDRFIHCASAMTHRFIVLSIHFQ